ncbi:hypothetical protein V7S43_008992 [Phytophthora oleae]|uniref:Protein kinase domain-containing protein n=1 Tax=Phytophthora oleae TaxID=2107226 RepID=A0ABD3FKU8_9STRA
MATLPVILSLLLFIEQVAALTYQETEYWETSDCSGPPFYMNVVPEGDCNVTYDCSPYTSHGSEYYRRTSCVDDTLEWAKSYNSTSFLMLEQFNITPGGCEEYIEGNVFLANDSCVKIVNSTKSTIATINSDGLQILKLFEDEACSKAAAKTFAVEKAAAGNRSCYDGQYKFYSKGGSSDTHAVTTISTGNDNPSTSSGLGSGTSIVIVAAALVVTVVACCIFFWCRRRSTRKRQDVNSSTVPSDVGGGFVNAVLAMEIPMESPPAHASASIHSSRGGGDDEEESGLYRDEIIIGSRVPREKVVVKRLLSRGGYGEVHIGSYNRRRVAIKMLLPETRKIKAHRLSFLAELKLMATLEHPQIVRLIGIAWDSPNDLCALLEFVPGGDLRALLAKYSETHRPIGFTYEKVKIASHVTHALTYLHSLNAPVIHRDLKSRNILLTRELDAKLTDFGVSRERADRTMTAGVGTSLWMSPEVMMGERYDSKADIFSLGVVLSELDTHEMPYAHAKTRDGSGNRLPDTVILQLVAAQKLRADFSQGGPESLMLLGLACVAFDPKDRPTAPEVLYRLQKVLREMAT